MYQQPTTIHHYHYHTTEAVIQKVARAADASFQPSKILWEDTCTAAESAQAGREAVADRVSNSPNCLELHSYFKQWSACPGLTLCLHSAGNVSTLPLALMVFKEAKVTRTTHCHAHFKHLTPLNPIFLSCNAEHSPFCCLPRRCVTRTSHNRVSTFRWPDSLTDCPSVFTSLLWRQKIF